MRQLIIFSLLFVLFGCKSKKEDSNSAKITVENDFTEQFSPLELKYTIADTTIDKNIAKEKALKIYGNKYYPDTLIYRYFEKGSKISFYPIGKAQNEDQEIYILMKAISGERKAAYILCYDNQLKYKDGTMICQTDGDKKTSYVATIDKYFNIMIRRTDFVLGQEPNLTESFLAYNNSGKLGEVVTNDTDEEIALQNPIDTLRQTKKFTGDYYLNKTNLVSLRDSKDTGELIFFYHYEKDKQDCSGEIKDVIKMTGNNTATYIKDGDPCVMNIIFGNNQLTIKEDHGCGNKKNSLDCTLDGVFIKTAKKTNTKGKTDTKTKTAASPLNNNVPIEPVNPKNTTTKQNDPKTVKPAQKVVKKPVVKPTTPVPTPKKPVIKQPDIQ